MSGIGNLKQVVSTTQAVERVQEAQNRSPQTGQQHFAESLEREAKDQSEKVQDNPDVRRPEDDDEREGRDGREGKREDDDTEDEVKNEAASEEVDDEDDEHHVDVIA